MTGYSPLEPRSEESAIEQEQGSGPDTKRKEQIQRKSATVFPYRGKWRVQYLDLFGRQRTKTADTKRNAYLLLAQINHGQTHSVYRLPTKELPNVGSWLEFWISKREAELKPATLQGYRINIRKWLIPALGELRIDQLQPMHIQELYSHLQNDRGLSAGSVNRIHALLSGAMKTAVIYGLINHSPVSFVQKPKEKHKPVEVFSAEEVEQILLTASSFSPRQQLRWILALRYGMRQGEVLGLRFADVGRGVLRVARAVKPIAGSGIVEISPKSDNSIRDIAIDKQTEGLFAEIESEPGLFVFGGIKPVDATKDYRDWKKLLRRAGVRSLPLHAARHTCASLLVARGVNPIAVSRLLGHSSVEYTMRTYVHLAESEVFVPEVGQAKIIEQ